MMFYKLDNSKMAQIQADLGKRKAAENTADRVDYAAERENKSAQSA